MAVNEQTTRCFPDLGQPSFNPKHAVTFIEGQNLDVHAALAQDIFRGLLDIASKPKQSSGNACAKLCGFVEQCSKSSSSELSQFAFAEKTSIDLFDFFIEWNEQDQHRAMRVVLDVLNVAITKNPDPVLGGAIKSRILTDTVEMMTLQSTRPAVKSAMTALDHFLNKKLLYLPAVLEIYQDVHRNDLSSVVSWETFIAKIFEWMELQYVWPIAGKLLVTIFTCPWDEAGDLRFHPDAWHRFLRLGLALNVEYLEVVKLYVLMPIFKSDHNQAMKYLNLLSSLQSLTSEDHNELSLDSILWLATLEAGKKVGAVGEPNDDSESQLAANVLEDILCHSSHEARSSAVSILIASPSTSRPYAVSSLNLLRKHLPAFHADTDAKFRYDVLGHSRNMIKRIMGAIASLQKEQARVMKKASKKGMSADEIAALTKEHIAFVNWYIGFLKDELVPTASYQRHITSLKAMEFVLNSGVLQGDLPGSDQADSAFALLDTTWLRAVLDLVMDPFDDVRETAASPNSNTVAYQQGVVDDLESRLSSAEKDLAAAVLETPVHGGFAALRYIWEALSKTKYTQEELDVLEALQTRCLKCCDRVWQLVRHVLCDDSPEGHLPEELEEVDGLDTKDLLSYSFRAVHESSNLLRAMANNAQFHGKPGLLAPDNKTFDSIGNLTFDELSNLRHRGAFSTVTHTFAGCCQQVKHYTSVKGGDTLLDKWYEGAIHCIYSQASTTRRSAGIPALIVGILSANAENPSFPTVMEKLRNIAQEPALISQTDGSNLPQVHALNCIKDIFKSSYLSKRAEPYLTESLQLAATSLRSEVWAIRNCGLILLRSLIDCLFGTNESKLSMEAGWDGRTTRIAWHKYKDLPAVIVNLLELGQLSTTVSQGVVVTAESVFPALDIIRRAGPPEEFKDTLFGLVASYLNSRFWHVREIAARTLCSFLLKPDWIQPVRDLLSESHSSANKLHGTLLTFKFLLERLRDVMPEQLLLHREVLPMVLEEVRHANSSLHACAEARAVYFEIVTIINSLDHQAQLGETNSIRLIRSVILPRPGDGSSRAGISSALLESKEAQCVADFDIRQVATGGQIPHELRLDGLVDADVNVACDTLEMILAYEAPPMGNVEVSARIVALCISACMGSAKSELRALALGVITKHLDVLLSSRRDDLIPRNEELSLLWANLQANPMNPGLADAIVESSGSLLAAVVANSGTALGGDTQQWIRSWGEMMSRAGLADNTFDNRMAAATSLRAFSKHVKLDPKHYAHLPWLLALYDALNDDDEEIREVAATATEPILGRSVVAMEGNRRLLAWLVEHYGATTSPSGEFHTQVACRMMGHYPLASRLRSDAVLGQWQPAEQQLASAMRFDDSLFVIEEQNLYIDEVREARRWREAFQGISYKDENSSSSEVLQALVGWTSSGLRTLARLAESDDGVLGWASKPDVFAICARIVILGAALAGSHAGIQEELQRFFGAGQKTRVHGLLLSMCEL
ncbi:hypothetical protein PG999_007064 [Apiospora kogelbergensis]|uniref:DUF2428 domain-containing protein n=1 Tax=Apiospora kogelbergensis TaxID=1337665 RepID=A0AAW0QX90_9PEZI